MCQPSHLHYIECAGAGATLENIQALGFLDLGATRFSLQTQALRQQVRKQVHLD